MPPSISMCGLCCNKLFHTTVRMKRTNALALQSGSHKCRGSGNDRCRPLGDPTARSSWRVGRLTVRMVLIAADDHPWQMQLSAVTAHGSRLAEASITFSRGVEFALLGTSSCTLRTASWVTAMAETRMW